MSQQQEKSMEKTIMLAYTHCLISFSLFFFGILILYTQETFSFLCLARIAFISFLCGNRDSFYFALF